MAREIIFSVYPNPYQSAITVAVPSGNIAFTCRLFDALGNTVKQEENPAGTLDFSDLHEGIYLLEVSSGSAKGYRKIVKFN